MLACDRLIVGELIAEESDHERNGGATLMWETKQDGNRPAIMHRDEGVSIVYLLAINPAQTWLTSYSSDLINFVLHRLD